MLSAMPSGGKAHFTGRDMVLLAVLVSGQLMIAADFSLASMAMPSVAEAFHVAPSVAQWVISAMMLAFAGFLLVGGRLSDIFGQKNCLIAGIALYTAGAIGSGLSPSMGVLIACRGLQGLGAALLFPAVLSLIFLSFTEGANRFLALTISTAIQYVASPVSVIVAGKLFAVAGWHGAFLLTVPIGAFVLCAAPFVLPSGNAASRARQSVDFPGAILATLGCSLLVWTVPALVMEGYGVSRMVLEGFAASVAVLAAFVLLQRSGTAPLIPGDVLRSKNLVPGVLVISVLTIAVAGLVSLALISMQQGLHFTPLQSGLSILPYGLVSVAVSIAAPRVSPFLFRRSQFSLIVSLLSIAGCYLLVSVAPATPVSHLYLMVALIVAPIGGNLAFTLAMTEALRFVRPEHQGIASGVVYTGMQLSIAIGVALLVAAADPSKLGAGAVPSLAAFAGSFRVGAVICLIGIGFTRLLARVPAVRAELSPEIQAL